MQQFRHLLLTAVFPTLTFFLLFSMLIHSNSTTAADLPDGTFVVRVHYNSVQELNGLAGYDVWEYNNLVEKYVLVAVDKLQYTKLRDAGWIVEIDSTVTAVPAITTAATTYFNGYRTVDELYADLDTLNTAHPSLSEIVVYGESYCKQQNGCTTPGNETHSGFDLKAIRITNETISNTSTISNGILISGTKPVFFLMANIHAREITTPELAMRMADWLLTGYGNDPTATWLVDWHEIWIVPTANPDGHWLAELGIDYHNSPLYHRKNGNGSNGCNTWPSLSYSQYGVDLNRNHSFNWGGASTSTDPCSAVFRGPSSLSEPETALLETLVKSLIPDQRGATINDAAPTDTTGLFITIHSYSELVLWPWAHVNQPAPNRTELAAIGDKLATFNGYTSCQPTDCLYAASGTSDDFAYGTLGIPAFTFEVGTQFMPPFNEIDDIQWPENAPAFQYAAKIARNPYELIYGPDVLTITTTAVSTTTLTITTTLDDSNNGNQPIAAASYTINTPFWVTGAISNTLTAVDAAFDNPVETATAVIDLTTLETGRHSLYIRAQDSEGNWGPVTAVFINNLPQKTYIPYISK
ncbi:MAG: peptidase M14 [Chloroflexi bacterium]|nr:peptidase M14 [Chloroflexota bacterium]